LEFESDRMSASQPLLFKKSAKIFEILWAIFLLDNLCNANKTPPQEIGEFSPYPSCESRKM
jgi:hypothetical protein